MWGHPPSAVRAEAKPGCSLYIILSGQTSQLTAGTNPLVPAFLLHGQLNPK